MNITNNALAVINDDQSLETVKEVIASILEEIDNKQWLIGDILVFLRFRAAHAPVAEMDIPLGEEWPEELLGIIDQNGYRIEEGIKDELLHWHRLVFDALVVLYDKERVMVWQKVDDGFRTERKFEEYLGVLGSMLSHKLNGKTLWAYYITSITYPETKRLPELAWTTHYDNRNLAKLRADNSEYNPYSIETLAQKQLEELVDLGQAKSTVIRGEIKKEKQSQAGYKWLLPLPYELKIKTSDGRIRVIVEFHPDSTNEDRSWFFMGAELLSYNYVPTTRLTFTLRGKELYVDDKLVGATPLIDTDPEIDKAIIALAGKMSWVIKPASPQAPEK